MGRGVTFTSLFWSTHHRQNKPRTRQIEYIKIFYLPERYLHNTSLRNEEMQLGVCLQAGRPLLWRGVAVAGMIAPSFKPLHILTRTGGAENIIFRVYRKIQYQHSQMLHSSRDVCTPCVSPPGRRK